MRKAPALVAAVQVLAAQVLALEGVAAIPQPQEVVEQQEWAMEHTRAPFIAGLECIAGIEISGRRGALIRQHHGDRILGKRPPAGRLALF